MNGWVKVHRKLMKSSVWDNPNILKVWLWCLLKASHEEHDQLVGTQIIHLEEGQFVFGRKSAAEELKMKESTIYRYMKLLESLKNIVINSNNKFSVVTVENWGFYQCEDNESEQQMNNKWTTDEQQMDTNKNVKNVKKGKNIARTRDLSEFSGLLQQVIIDWCENKLERDEGYTSAEFEQWLRQVRGHRGRYEDKHIVNVIQRSMACSYKSVVWDWLADSPKKPKVVVEDNAPKDFLPPDEQAEAIKQMKSRLGGMFGE